MKFILGKKLGMNQIFDETGRVIPVTYIEMEPNFITQIKTAEKDGYSALQIGSVKAKKINKSQTGHLKSVQPLKFLKEVRVAPEVIKDLKVGDKIEADIFSPGDLVTIVGISKGKGFQGVVKRHGFSGGPASHGQKDRHRAPGSIGASFPEHVIKGKKMPGRMGSDRVTVKNLKVVVIDKENQLIGLGGAVPGRKGSLVMIKSS